MKAGSLFTLLLALTLTPNAFAAAGAFDIVVQGDKVCAIDAVSKASTCVSNIEGQPGAEDIVNVNLVEQAQALVGILQARGNQTQLTPDEFIAVGGTSYLTDAQLNYILNGYSELRIKKFGGDGEHLITSPDGKVHMPVLFSVFWKDKALGINGTINVRAEILIGTPDSTDSVVVVPNTNDIAATLRQAVQIDSYSDSGSPSRSEGHRMLEKFSRTSHFQILGVDNADQATVDLLQTIVGPEIMIQILEVPMARLLVKLGAAALFAPPPVRPLN